MGKVIRSFLVIFLFSFNIPFSFSQDEEKLELTITEARDYALGNNRAVRSSRIDIDIANKKISENLSAGLPQVSVDANYLHQFVVPEISFGPIFDVGSLPSGPVTGEDIRNSFSQAPPIPLGVMDNTVIDFTLSQLVFNGQYFVALQTAKIVRQMSEKNLARTEDQVKKDVELSYYSILIVQENIRLLKDTEKTLNQMFDEISGMNLQGLNEETDVDQVNINRSNVQALITSMESQLDIAYKRFKYLIGVDFTQPVELTDSLDGFIEEGNLRYLTENGFDLQNSLEYQIVDIQENVNEQLVKLEKARYLPTISAFYRHQEQTNQPAFNFAVKDVIGATLNLPIISGGLRSSKVSQAKLDLQKARLSKQDTELGLTMGYETARNNYQAAWSTFVINRESMELAKKIYDRSVIKFREGVTSSFELTQIQNQFLTAESNYYTSLLSLLQSKAELDRILRINQ